MHTIRRYAKTPRAWEALARPDVVGRQAHTLMLMANGRRSEQELALMPKVICPYCAAYLKGTGELESFVTPDM